MSGTGDPYEDEDDLEPVSARAAKRKDELAVLDPGEAAEGDDVDTTLAFKPLNDFGNAIRLKMRFGDDMMHVSNMGWHVWDGVRWDREHGQDEAVKRGHQVAEAIRGEAAALKARFKRGRDGRVAALLKAAVATGNMARVHGMLAAAEPYLKVAVDDLDADPFLLATPSGTVELGPHCTLRENRREDRMTRAVSVPWNTRAMCPRWERFLEEIMPQPDMRAFLQRIMGLTLTGSTRDNGFFIFWGGGDNGKSTFMNIMRAILAEYAAVTPITSFIEKRDGYGGGQASPDMARLPGARLVTASEPKENARLDESLVKDITGGDRMIARHLNQGFFEFNPQCKVIVPTNHRPIIRGTGHAIWKRIKLVPFTVQIPKERIDRALEAKLKEELPGIFQWMITGCEDWFVQGLNPPAEASAALEEYRADQDLVGEFLKSRCVLTGDGIDDRTNRPYEAAAKKLREAFLAWCKEEGNDAPLSNRAFGEKLMSHGLKRRKSVGLTIYVGVHLPEAHELV